MIKICYCQCSQCKKIKKILVIQSRDQQVKMVENMKIKMIFQFLMNMFLKVSIY